jgi:hypothetical protein
MLTLLPSCVNDNRKERYDGLSVFRLPDDAFMDKVLRIRTFEVYASISVCLFPAFRDVYTLSIHVPSGLLVHMTGRGLYSD